MKGFRDFLLKGNLVSMAVGLVMALAFETLVLALVQAFITPAIGLAAGGHGNVAASGFQVRGVLFPVGLFITALISFVIIAAIVY
ncbi:large-conductance mechanosensitive channel protein, partial [mine drainage metagenome]